MNAPMVAMIALWILIVSTLRGPFIVPVAWATLVMEVIVQVGTDRGWSVQGGHQFIWAGGDVLFNETNIRYLLSATHTSRRSWSRIKMTFRPGKTSLFVTIFARLVVNSVDSYSVSNQNYKVRLYSTDTFINTFLNYDLLTKWLILFLSCKWLFWCSSNNWSLQHTQPRVITIPCVLWSDKWWRRYLTSSLFAECFFFCW